MMKPGYYTALMILGCLCPTAFSQADLSLGVAEQWSALFGGSEPTYHLVVDSPKQTRGRLLWRLAANGATLQRGEAAVTSTPSEAARVAVQLKLPAVRDGVALPATLTASFVPEGNASATASVEKPLWIFAPDPFTDRQQWLKALDIKLFDPEKTTAPVFTRAGIPFTLISRADHLAKADGMVVVGEGVSFRDYRALPDLMIQALAHGADVICLAPSGGEFPLPGINKAGKRSPLTAMQFHGTGMIHELDKRLDADAWPPNGVCVVRSLKLVGQRGPVVAEVFAGDAGWPWVQLEGREGTLVVVGFPIVAKWSDGPTPRYLLLRMLDVLTEASEEKK